MVAYSRNLIFRILIMTITKNGFIGIFIAFVFCVLSGCAAPSRVNLYDGKDAVKIHHLNHDEGLIVWDRIEVWAVNEKFIGSTYVGATTQLAPGLQKIAIHKYFHPGMGPVYEGFATLTAELRPGALLALNGKTDGGEIVVWLQDELTGEIVSEEARGVVRAVQQNQSMVPI